MTQPCTRRAPGIKAPICGLSLSEQIAGFVREFRNRHPTVMDRRDQADAGQNGSGEDPDLERARAQDPRSDSASASPDAKTRDEKGNRTRTMVGGQEIVLVEGNLEEDLMKILKRLEDSSS